MTTNRIVQQIDITGGVTRKFTSSLGRANSELSKISDSLAEQRREQAKLQAQIDKGDANEDQLRSYRRQMERLTKEIDDQEEAYQRLNKAQNQRNRRLAVGGALLGAAAAGGAVAIGAFRGQFEAIRDLREIAAETGIAFEDLGALSTQARDFFPGLSQDRIADTLGQAQRELALRLEEDNPEYDLLRSLVGDADNIHDQFNAIIAHGLTVDDPDAFFERAFGGTEGEIFAGLARQGNLEAFGESVRTVDQDLVNQYATLGQAQLAVQELGQSFGDVTRSITAGLAPAITFISAVILKFVRPISMLIKENETLARIIGVVLVAGIAALTLAGLIFLATVVGPWIIAGFGMIAAWFPIIAIIVGVGLAIAGIIYLMNKLGLINIDLSGVTEGFEAVRSSIDLDAVNTARQQVAANNQQGDTIINQTNNIEALGDAEEIAQTVGDETSNALHQSIYVPR